MRAKPGLNRESGVTLVELMIALGIFAILSYFATQFFTRVSQSDAEMSAKTSAQAELAKLTTILEKDLKFREIDKLDVAADLCTTPICRTFSIVRLAPGGGTYTVTYDSSCRNMPPEMRNLSTIKFDKTTLQLDANVAANKENRSQCLQVLNCQAGQYPSLVITTTNVPPGAKIPNYPPLTPNIAAGRNSFKMIGAAICAVQTEKTTVTDPNGSIHTVSKNKVVLEGAFLGAGDSLRIERKETVISSGNIAKIQMLPNE